MRWFQRMVAAAILSAAAVASTVGASFGQAKSDIRAVAEQITPSIGLSVPVVEGALKRRSYGIKPGNDAAIADQQKIADAFLSLGVLPKAIIVSDAQRKPRA